MPSSRERPERVAAVPLASRGRCRGLLLAVLLAGAATTVVWIGITATEHDPAPAPVIPAGLDVRAVEVPSPSGATLRGWFVPGRRGHGAVLLVHGIRASRSEMVGRARFLVADGFTVMLVDLRAHGESTGARTTLGALESHDVRAAVAFLRSAAPGERIGIVGNSLGGAAALLGRGPLPVDALVLESVYPTIDAAVRNRLRARLGSPGSLLAPLALATLSPVLGVAADDLRPVDAVGAQTAPVLVIGGEADPYTPVSETRELYERAREPKELWIVPGAGHVNMHRHARAEYERRVGTFLERNLRREHRRLAPP